MRLRSERIVTPAGTIAGEVRIANGRIEGVDATGQGRRAPAAGEAIDLGAHWLAPGLIDLHVHGGGGAQCNTADADEVLAVAAFHAAHGTTALLATTVAADPYDLAASLRAIRRAMELGDSKARSAGAAGVGVGALCSVPTWRARSSAPSAPVRWTRRLSASLTSLWSSSFSMPGEAPCP